MSGFTNAAKNQALNALNGVNPTNTWVWLSLHTADPGLTGASEVATGSGYNRQQVTWAAAASAQMVGTQVTFNVPTGTTIQFWGIWTAVTSGTFGFGEPLPSNQTYGQPGLYFLTVTLTATG